MRSTEQFPRGWLGLTLGVAVAQRVILWLCYPPVTLNDTPSYWRLAGAVAKGFHDYDGTRTPGYPALLALAGSDRAVYLIQLVMGLLITLMVFFIGWKAAESPAFGAAAALAHTLNPGQFFFEANLITETAGTFWLALMLLGVFFWFHRPERRSLWLAAGISAAGALAGLTRPVYLFVPFWVALWLLPAWQGERRPLRAVKIGKWRLDLAALIAGVVPALLLIGAWVNFIYQNYHVLSPSAMTGYNLIQHTGYYFEDVPDQYAALRDTFLKYRDARIAEYGTAGNAIWDAIPEMQKVSGLSFYDLSRVLQKISVQLILEHPAQYLRYAAQGWWFFWRAPVYWTPAQISPVWLRSLISGLVLAARAALFGSNLIFLLTSAAALFSRKLRHTWRINAFWAFVAASVWVTSILQTLPDHGDNPRFLVPTQTWVVLWVLWVAWWSFRAWQERRQSMVKRDDPL